VLREALAIMRDGVAGPEEIDLVMTSSLGRRHATAGPLRGADLGGLDTFREIAGLLMPELAKDEGVLDILDELLAQGRNG
jgi:3-hydroxybutyryl-CoA dehydrogenase